MWSIDQSDSAGKNYGGTIYIWKAKDLEKVNKAAVAETVDLGGDPASLCMAQTGANPVRPHMLTMNRSNTHAISREGGALPTHSPDSRPTFGHALWVRNLK